MKSYRIKDWFFEKNIKNKINYYTIGYSNIAEKEEEGKTKYVTFIEKETEKAIYTSLCGETHNGNCKLFGFWIPKSCIEEIK